MDSDMESAIDKLRIHTLRAQVEASRLHSVALARKFDAATTSTEKTRIAREYSDALKQTNSLQLMLELLERKYNEGKSGD
jgi:dimeric dUTPase (all-alpha-NTP-PPase superfamily)